MNLFCFIKCRTFHKTLPRSMDFLNRISVRFYETRCTLRSRSSPAAGRRGSMHLISVIDEEQRYQHYIQCMLRKGFGEFVSAVCDTIYVHYLSIPLWVCTHKAELNSPCPFRGIVATFMNEEQMYHYTASQAACILSPVERKPQKKYLNCSAIKRGLPLKEKKKCYF